MGLESGVNYLGDLVSTNPTGTDPKGQGDDHIRNTKRAAKQSFAGWTKAIMVTGTDTGSANTYVLSPTPALPSLDDGMLVVFTPANSNTTASTLQITGFPAKNLRSVSGAALAPNEIAMGQTVAARYNGTEFRLISISKQYADQLAFASALPAISALTIYQAVFNDGSGGLWKRALPQSTAGNQGKVLKSTGTDGYPEDSSTWDWDGWQGRTVRSTAFTLALTDRAIINLCSGTFTVGITAAATLGPEYYTRVMNVGTGLITVDPNGSETVTMAGYAAKSLIVLLPGEGVDLYCDGNSDFLGVLAQGAGAGPHLYATESTAPTYAATTWQTRLVSTLITNTLGVTYSAGDLQNVPAGVYRAKFQIAGGGVDRFVGRIYNATTAAEIFHGEVGFATAFNPDTAAAGITTGDAGFTLTATSTLRLQSYASNNNGAGSWGATGASPFEKGASVWLTRISP